MKTKKYDVVVCDYQMPGKDGLQFLQELRQKGNSIPFIIFTGKGREEVVIKALNQGADHYESKNGNPERVYSELSHEIISAVKTRRAEQDLRIQREELQIILDSMPVKIWYKDGNNRLVRVNKAFAEYMGVSKADLEGKPLCDLFPLDIVQKCWEEDKEVITTGQPKTDILDRHESAQGVRWFSTGKVPCRDKDGNIIGTINFSLDITERKKALERLRVLNEKLGVVGKLTRHDVRNKLSAVVGNTYLAKKTLPNDHKALDYLRKIESACGEITRVLDFAAVYESLGVEELVLVDVEKAVEEAVSLVSELKGVKVVNDCQGLSIMADSALVQLFFNLIENSLKHGKNVSQIKIYCEEGKDRLRLFCEDNGVGISKASKPKLFDVGFTTGNGSGYGLPLVKSMMEIYGWTIDEEGEPGKGARFVMTIPSARYAMRARP